MPRGFRALAVGAAVALAVLDRTVRAGRRGLDGAGGGVRGGRPRVGLGPADRRPGPRVAAVVLAAGAVAISAAAGLTRTDPYLVWVPVAVAVSVMAAFLHQVFRGGGRPRLTEGIASSSALWRSWPRAPRSSRCPRTPTAGPGRWSRCLVSRRRRYRRCCSAVGCLRAGCCSPRWSLGTGVSVWLLWPSVASPSSGRPCVGVLVAGISHSTTRVLFALPGAATAPGAVAVGAAGVLVVGVVVYILARIFSG